jgi:hypothetical protein
MRDFRNLQVWEKAHNVTEVKRMLAGFIKTLKK